jgi:hypothetical protein
MSEEEEGDAPTQGDINEGITLEYLHNGGMRAWFERRVIAEISEDENSEALFKTLSRLGRDYDFPRIFFVNDHGNVTEYGYDNTVIGEWV